MSQVALRYYQFKKYKERGKEGAKSSMNKITMIKESRKEARVCIKTYKVAFKIGDQHKFRIAFHCLILKAAENAATLLKKQLIEEGYEKVVVKVL